MAEQDARDDLVAAPRESLTDSPWFWLGLFLSGALVALLLTYPKYSWRQVQLEKQYQARVNSGYATEIFPSEESKGPAQLSKQNLRIPLRPLVYTLAAGVLLVSTLFWWTQRQRGKWQGNVKDG
jgi:hypothetical protein